MTSHNTARPTRIDYSERRLTSLNGYAMVAIGLAFVACAAWRLTSIDDGMEGRTLLLSHLLPGGLCILAAALIAARPLHAAAQRGRHRHAVRPVRRHRRAEACAGPIRSTSSAASRCARATSTRRR